MLNHLKSSLALSKKVTVQIIQANDEQLESIKDEMTDEMDVPIGWHTMGLPLIASVMLTLISFSLPQISLWHGISNWMNWSEHAFLTGTIITDFIYCIIINPLMILIARGQYWALKSYVYLTFSTTVLVVLFFIYTTFGMLLGAEIKTTHLVASIIGTILIALSLRCLNSMIFYRMIAYCLHNRAWRKQIESERKHAS
ncbi:hypothetical protein [Pantoea sp. OXWO6B1]|uniref:hypothetical protein n=1 Tax=Pantoea sp. OXWO6B1 TaxID=1835724 RepID=UPI0007C869BB|nr:hypothetical protein [Pantoea sp. OXWO6B1]OAE07198.1 hypothetical protein A6A26_06015 [Pantoea sp. OXWO6B1]